MSRNKRTLMTAALAALAALSLAACTGGGVAAPDETITLKYSHFASANSFPSLQMEEFKKRIEERTDGKVTVEVYPGGTLLGAGDTFDGTTAGIVDIGLDSPAYDTGRFPFSSVINLPVGFTSSTQASAAFLELLTEQKPAEYEGFEIITAFTTEPGYIQSKDRITTQGELAGKRLRVAGAQLPLFEQLGAAPVALPMPEVPQSLQTGVISGYMSSREVMKDFGLADQVRYVTDYPFGVSNSFVAVMDKKRYDALPEGVRAALQELKPEMSAWAAEYHDGSNVKGALELAEQEGVETVEVAPDEVAAWDAVRAAQIDAWVQRNASAGFDARAVVDRLVELKDSQQG